MTDWRYQGQGMRRRMGAPSSHLDAANGGMLNRTIRESGLPHSLGPESFDEVVWGSGGRGHPDEAALKHIQSRDPDAGSVQPTKAAYKAHQEWAIDRYGKDVWKTYKRGGWGRQSEV